MADLEQELAAFGFNAAATRDPLDDELSRFGFSAETPKKAPDPVGIYGTPRPPTGRVFSLEATPPEARAMIETALPRPQSEMEITFLPEGAAYYWKDGTIRRRQRTMVVSGDEAITTDAAREALAPQVKKKLHKDWANQVLNQQRIPGVIAGNIGAMSNLATPGRIAQRMLGFDEAADETLRMAEAFNEAMAEREQKAYKEGETIVPPILTSGARGAYSTIPGMILGGGAGGAAGAIGLAGLTEFDAALTEGKDAGLDEAETVKYATTKGLIEGGIAAAFQKVGMGGLETAAAKLAVRDGVKKGMRQLLSEGRRDILHEVPEELFTELGLNAASYWHGVDPEAVTPERIRDTVAQTIVQTLITGGTLQSAQILGEVADRRPAPATGKPKPGEPGYDEYIAGLEEQVRGPSELSEALHGVAEEAPTLREGEVPFRAHPEIPEGYEGPARGRRLRRFPPPDQSADSLSVDEATQPAEPAQPEAPLPAEPAPPAEPSRGAAIPKITMRESETPKSALRRHHGKTLEFEATVEGQPVGSGYAEITDDAVILRTIAIDPMARGGGFRLLQMAEEVLKYAEERGLKFQTDSSLTMPAVKMVDRLQARGYQVEKHPDAKVVGDKVVVSSGEPAFTISRPPSADTKSGQPGIPTQEAQNRPDLEPAAPSPAPEPPAAAKPAEGQGIDVIESPGAKRQRALDSKKDFPKGTLVRWPDKDGNEISGVVVNDDDSMPTHLTVEQTDDSGAHTGKVKVVSAADLVRRDPAPATEKPTPFDGWRDDQFKARDYAAKLGVADQVKDWSDTKEIVATIDRHFGSPILEAFERLDKEQGGHNFVSMADLREATGLDRETFDKALRQLRVDGKFAASGAQSKDTVTPEGLARYRREQDAGITEAGHNLTYVSRKISQEPEPKPAEAPRGLPDHFAEQLRTGKSYRSIKEARKEAADILGKPIEPGTPEAKMVDEAVEQGVVREADRLARSVAKSDAEAFDLLLDLYQRQPPLSTKTSTQMLEQAFSTPAPLAWLATVMADVQKSDVVYDSAAGNGMLLIGAEQALANELNPERFAALQAQGIQSTKRDATEYRPDRPVDKVIINPPFGEVPNDKGESISWNIDGMRTNQVDHAIVMNTLPSMKQDGRAVIIIGSKGFEKGNPKDDRRRASAYRNRRKFYDTLYDNYNVVDHFTVSGDLYKRQGAGFPVDVIVVDGKGASSRPKPYNFVSGGLPEVFTTWEGLKNGKLRRNVEPTRGEPGGPATGERGDDGLGDVPPASKGEGARDVEGASGPGKRPGKGVVRPGRDVPGGERPGERGGQPGVPGSTPGAAQSDAGGLPDAGDADRGGRDPGQPGDVAAGSTGAPSGLTPDVVDAALDDALGPDPAKTPPKKSIGKKKSPAKKKAPAEPRKGEIGMMLGEGDVATTASGRTTTPFPKVDFDSNRKAINTEKRVQAWLQENAIAEAESRGDDYNARIFRNETPGRIPQASKDAMEEYLFGQQPPVPAPLLKPLAHTPRTLAHTIRDILPQITARPNAGQYGQTKKLYLSEVYDAVRERVPGLQREKFNELIVEANREGLVTLSRADLVDPDERERIAASEVASGPSTWHLLRTDKPIGQSTDTVSADEPPARPKSALRKKAEAAEEQARKEFEEAKKRFLDAFGGATLDVGLNPQKLAIAVDFAKAAVKLKIFTFAKFVTTVSDMVGEERTLEIADYLEAVWDRLGKRSDYSHLDPAGKVADIIKPKPKPTPAKAVPIKQDAETEFQVAYSPSSKSENLGTLVPRTHEGAVRRSLEAIEDRYGDLDSFVATELGYGDPSHMRDADGKPYFAAEQIDAIAMAIAQHKDGKAFINGDQTGVGKGRVAAAMMVYAKRNGMVPVFITEKPDLYADMLRDLGDIGQNPEDHRFNPLPTNALAKSGDTDSTVNLPDGRQLKQGPTVAKRILNEAVENFLGGRGLTAKAIPWREPDGSRGGRKEDVEFDAIFTNYSQLQPVAQELKDRHLRIQDISPHAFFILDESHTAGGASKDRTSQDQDRDSDKLSRAQIVREILHNAAGATFLSATYAKHPEVMDLYAKTGMTDAVDDPGKLSEAIQAGGVPLQQVVSEMLVEGGAYIRRERSYDGVTFEPKVAEVDLGKADEVATIFRAIHAFEVAQRDAKETITDDVVSGGGDALETDATGVKALDSTNFTSILWNLSDQMLLSLKAEEAAKEAIESWKRGETPVIATDQTFGAALDHYLEGNPASFGDEIDFQFSHMLRRYLDRSREIQFQSLGSPLPDSTFGGAEVVRVKETETRDRDGNQVTLYTYTVRLTDAQLGEKAVEAYRAAEELLENFAADMPASPIDRMRQIMSDAGMRVAEITGRQQMVDYSGGKMRLVSRPADEMGPAGKQRTIQGINNGDIDVVILNRSGATGVSMHASEKFVNQRPRHMIIAQAAKNIDEFMQMLGRIHRTGQVELPKFTLLMTNAPAETRPASVLVKKLSSLNANVTASSKGAVSFEAPDIINQIGNKVVGEYMGDHPELNEALDKPVDFNKNGTPRIQENTARRVTGRMALMSVAEQQKFWDDIIEAYNEEVAELDRLHKNPLKAGNVPLEATTLESFELFEGDRESDSPFRQPGFLEKIRAKKLGEPYKPEEIQAKLAEFYGEEPTPAVVKRWIKERSEEVAKTAKAEFDRRSAPLVKQEAVDSLRSAINSAEDSILGKLRSIAPGAVVSVDEVSKSGALLESTTGIVLSIKNKGGRDAIARSKWVAEIALASSDKVLRIPFSRIDQSTETEGPEGTKLQVVGRGRLADDATLEEFKDPGVKFETRYVATGNILAGFSKLKDEHGHVVFFTDKEGKPRRGILLPRRFDAQKWQDKQPVSFSNADDVKSFLDAGGSVASPDHAVHSIQIDEEGKLHLRSPKSRQRSGKYTTNRKLLDAMGRDFVSKGNLMVATVPGPRIIPTLEALLEIGALQTGTNKELARSITGGTQEMKPVADTVSQRDPTKQTRETAQKADASQIAAADIIKTMERLFDVPIRVGGISGRAAGIYKVLPEIVRTTEQHVGNLAVAAHEVAHHLDKKTGISKDLPDDLASELAGLDYEPKGRVFEGFAEYIRHYITENDAAMLAPKFTDFFEKTWLPQNPKWDRAIRESRRYAQQYANQGVFQEIRSLIGNRPGDDLSFSERWKRDIQKSINRVVSEQVDRYRGLQLLNPLLDAKGYEGTRPYDVAFHYSMSEDANAAMALREGVHDAVNGSKIGSVSIQGLREHLKNDAEYDEAVTYAYAQHTLYMQQRRQNYSTGLDPERAQFWVDKIANDPDKKARFDKFRRDLSRFNNDLLEMLVRAGAMAPEAKDKMIAFYGDNYFPLHRVREGGQGLFSGAKMFNLPPAVRGRSRAGSGRPIVDPIDATISRAIHFYGRAGQAQVAHSLISALDPRMGGVEGAGGLLDRLPPGRKVHEGTIAEILDKLVEEDIVEEDDARAMKIAAKLREGQNISQENWRWFAERHDLDPYDTSLDDMVAAAETEKDALAEIALWRADYTPNATKRTVLYHDKEGNPHLYELDPFLYDTALGMNRVQLGLFSKIARAAFSVPFKMATTGLSPAFAAQNLIADYFTVQGRSRKMGLESLWKPWGHLIRYAAYRAGHQGSNQALYDVFREMAGEVYSMIGTDLAARQRTRKRLLGKTRLSRFGLTLSEKGELLSHAKDVLTEGLDDIQSILAISDAPPRLAEMEAEIRDRGYEPHGKQWRRLHDGAIVDHLPQHVRIAGMRAAAEATINFKRFGTRSPLWESWIPYRNAAIQASYRQIKQVKNLRRIGEKGSQGREAKRYMIYLSALAAAEALHWMFRHDDDDYIEEEDWLEEYWTFGWNGKTYFRVRKPRDEVGFMAIIKLTMERAHGIEGDSLIDTMVRDLWRRVPTGGGFIPATGEVLMNYDTFRGRDITPHYVKRKPAEFRYDNYTSSMSKAIGQVTGRYLGISPLQVEHILDESSGGVYGRINDMWESANSGELGLQHIPGMRAIVMNRHQGASVDDFYEAQKEADYAWQREPNAANRKHFDRLNDYADLMSEIRATEGRSIRGRRTFQYEPYIVGLAREAMGRKPLENHPSPFADPDAPEGIREAVKTFSVNRASTAILSHGYPLKAAKDKTYEETVREWKAKQQADASWLKEHKDSPIVQQAIQEVLRSKSFQRIRRGEGQPQTPSLGTYDSVADYQEARQNYSSREARWWEIRQNAMSWLDAIE